MSYLSAMVPPTHPNRSPPDMRRERTSTRAPAVWGRSARSRVEARSGLRTRSPDRHATERPRDARDTVGPCGAVVYPRTPMLRVAASDDALEPLKGYEV